MNQSKSNLVSSAEQILGYNFRKPSLLEHALTHGSYSNGTISYERLEFIGDAALSLTMANYLNVTYPDLKPGHISKLRSANVSNEKLARVAVRRNIYPLVQINSPQLDKQVKKFAEAVKQEPEDEIYGGSTKKAPKVLADVVEAIAAAIYQDCNNLDMMWEVVKKLLEPLITADTFDEQPVTALTEFCQKNGKVPQFKPSREGKKTINFKVLIDGEKVGYGSSKNKDIARLNAARDALEKLNVEKSNLSINAHTEVRETKGMSVERERGKREGHVADPPQHQHPKPALSPGLTASAQPAPESEESTKYEELEESTESNESQESEESTESEEDIPYIDKVDSYQRKTGYNVTVEGRERRERRLPWCGIDIGWLLFILGFFLGGIPWLIGAIMLYNSRVDDRVKPGYISCTIAAVLALVVCIILDRQKELMIGDFRLL